MLVLVVVLVPRGELALTVVLTMHAELAPTLVISAQAPFVLTPHAEIDRERAPL